MLLDFFNEDGIKPSCASFPLTNATVSSSHHHPAPHGPTDAAAAVLAAGLQGSYWSSLTQPVEETWKGVSLGSSISSSAHLNVTRKTADPDSHR